MFMTIDRLGRGTLPEQVRRDLGLDQDQNLLVLTKTLGARDELVPAARIPRDQVWFHHPEMQARIAQAEADFREGHVTYTATPEEAQAFLDSLKG